MPTTLTGLPLHGRTQELRRIHDILARSRTDSATALVVVEGMPGIGKTRLLREAAKLAEGLGFRAVRQQPDDLRTPRTPHPLHPTHDSHHPLRSHAGARTAPAHTRMGTGALAVPAPAPAEHTPGHPLLMVLDDVNHPHPHAQPGPPPPRAATTSAPVVWLVARRPGAGPAGPVRSGPPLDDPYDRSERLLLGPLGPAAALRLAEDVLGAPPAPALTQLLHRADGHPRLLIELLAGLRDEGKLRLDGHEVQLLSQRLPERLATRVTATLEHYSSDCRQLLRVAAVLGHEVVYEDLAAMMRTSVAALLPVLEEVSATGALRVEGARTVFRNPLLRQLIADSVPATLRLALLREAAELRPAGPPDPGFRRPAADRSELSEQQRDLVDLVAEGLTNRQIARRLGLSPHTVNYHLRRLFKAYGVGSRIDLLQAAGRHGTPPRPRRT